MRVHGWDRVPTHDMYECRYCGERVSNGRIFAALGDTRRPTTWDINHKIHVLLHALAQPCVIVRYVPPTAVAA